MARFPSLGDKATVPDILKMSPRAGKALIEMHEPIMRGPSALTEGQREVIAAYVSGLNQCRYCYGVHSEAAKAYGDVNTSAVDRMMENLETAGFDPKLTAMLRFAGKLTRAPASVTDEDAQAARGAGWDDQALHDATMVVCCFNFMNRLLEAHGVHGHEALYRERGPMLKKYGYLPLIRLLGV